MFDEFKNAFQRPNNAHVQLIIINVVVFLIMGVLFVSARVSGLDGIFTVLYDQFSIPPKFFDFIQRPWTLITYSFAHSYTYNVEYQLFDVDIFHILFNMLGLYWFGRVFNEYLGSDKLVATYILGALAGGVFYLIMFNTIPFFVNNSNFPGMVGASAAVFAVLTAIATLIPDYSFYLILIGPVRVKYIALFYIVISFVGSVGPNAGGNLAHLGGALMGYIYVKQVQAGVNWGGWITATLDWFKDLFSSKPKVKVSYRKDEPRTKTEKNPNKASQEEIDRILDKISDRGYESLTKEEKEKLFNASKK